MLSMVIVLLILLSASLIMYVSCLKSYLKSKEENASLKEENARLSILLSAFRESSIKGNNSTTNSIDSNVKEAVRYAMLKSHPDNGGKSEDFVKFRNLYERMK